jgi:lipoprotein NlpD
MPYRAIRYGAVALLAIALVGCASKTRAPVEDRTALPATIAPPGVTSGAQPAAAAEPEIRAPTRRRAARTAQQAGRAQLGGDDEQHQQARVHAPDALVRGAGPAERQLMLGVQIQVGERLVRLAEVSEARPGTAPAAAAPPVAASGPRNADNYKSSPKAFKEPYSEQALRDVARAPQAPPETVAMAAPSNVAKSEPPPKAPAAAAPDIDDDEKIDWVWPAKGKVVVGFSETANLKGIDIAGASGEPVIASAGGKVVYVGNGLRGYGKLVIVKHNKTWLSAYAHNREILVKEGQQVGKGQKIAEMGNTDADTVKLHFEIRRLGKHAMPVQPDLRTVILERRAANENARRRG